MFALVSDHGALGDWVPLVQEVIVTHPRPMDPGVSTIGTTRVITFKGGLEIVEEAVRQGAKVVEADVMF